MAMEFGFFMRGQYPADADMQQTFAAACDQARVADELGYTYILKGQHYSSTPLQALQLVPFLSRIMVEAPNAKLVTGIELLPLHQRASVRCRSAPADPLLAPLSALPKGSPDAPQRPLEQKIIKAQKNIEKGSISGQIPEEI